MSIPMQADGDSGVGVAWMGTLESFRRDLGREARQRLGANLAAKVDAADLVQETMLRAVQGLGRFRGRTPSELRGWLRSILDSSLSYARRHHLDAARRRVDREVPIEAAGEPAGAGDTPSRVLIRSEQKAAMVLALLSLTQEDRRVISWRYRDGLSFGAIGEELGVSADAARKQCDRAMGRLRLAMAPGHDSA